jgi:uncharacterized membrane protein
MEKRSSYRVTSIDILRGIVMVIMALDHTRDYFHVEAMTDDPLNLATTTVPLFFTRWITHYCAPIFVFLSGTSAYLAAKNKTPAEASLFLVKRGIWLIVAEVLIITLAITFNPLYNFVVWQVIWAIGWSMVILGLLVKFPYYTVLITGALLFFGHDIFDHLRLPQNGFAGNLVKVLFTSRVSILRLSETRFIGVFYAILPWTGVMLLGYAAGYWFRREFSAVKRKRLLTVTGISLILLFMLLRFINGYGEPQPWDKQRLLSFLNTSKYPPSLLYLCMTLGPALVALTLLENVRNRLSKFFSIYGRVPFFYYVLHFYLIHIILVVLFFATGHKSSEIVDPRVPFLFRPVNFGFALPIVYLIWISVVLALYLPCKWFNSYKLTHSQWWLKYL